MKNKIYTRKIKHVGTKTRARKIKHVKVGGVVDDHDDDDDDDTENSSSSSNSISHSIPHLVLNKLCLKNLNKLQKVKT